MHVDEGQYLAVDSRADPKDQHCAANARSCLPFTSNGHTRQLYDLCLRLIFGTPTPRRSHEKHLRRRDLRRLQPSRREQGSVTTMHHRERLRQRETERERDIYISIHMATYVYIQRQRERERARKKALCF